MKVIVEYKNSVPEQIWSDGKSRDAWLDEREAEGARTHALLLKDTDGVLSNSSTMIICGQVIAGIKSKLKAGLITQESAEKAIAKFQSHLEKAQAWADAYRKQGAKFNESYNAVQKRLDDNKISASDASQLLFQIRHEHQVARNRSTLASRKAKLNILREAKAFLS